MADEMAITQQRELDLADPRYTQCTEITPITHNVWSAIDVLNGAYGADAFSKAINDSYDLFYRKIPLAVPHDRLATSIVDIAQFLHTLNDNFIQFDEKINKPGKYLISFLCCFISIFVCLN
jgi:hypothetical protein